MTQEQFNYPRQFTSILEEKTNFYTHTGDGGSMCMASNDDRIERVWIEPGYATMADYEADVANAVNVYVPAEYDIIEAHEFIKNNDLDGYTEFTKPAFERTATTLEELIATLNEIEKKF